MDYLNIIDEIDERKGKQNNKKLTQEWKTCQNSRYLNHYVCTSANFEAFIDQV